MSFIEKFSKNVSYYSLISVLKLSLLWSSVGYGIMLSDAELEARIADRFRAFQAQPSVDTYDEPVHPGLRFVYHLSISNRPSAKGGFVV
jgi:hypothetical protein